MGVITKFVTCDVMRAETAAADPMVMSYFGANEGELYEAYIAASKDWSMPRYIKWLHTSDEECAGLYHTEAPTVVISRNFDELNIQFTGKANKEELVAFGKAAAIPQVITFNENHVETIFGERRPALILFTEETGTDYQDVFA